MGVLEAVRLALQQIRVQKLKSFFTLIGVMIGVMFLVAVVAVINGMSRYMEVEFAGKLMGINTFTLRHRPYFNVNTTEEEFRQWRRRPRIMLHDVDPVVAALPEDVKWSIESRDNIPVATRDRRARVVEAFAVDGDYFEIKKLNVESGRLIAPQEFLVGTNVLVIGQDVKERFFPNVDPLGKELKVGGLPYRIIGVMEKQGSVFGLSVDKFVVAPMNSQMARLLNRRPGVIDGIVLQSSTMTGMREGMERVRQVMRGRHKLRPGQPDDFAIETTESALSFWASIEQVLVMAGIVLPAIGLLVGAIVIMNVMLMAVSQRTREIGIRKALGARRRDILSQFLVEAATLSSVGALAGIALGIAIAALVEVATPMPASVSAWSIVVAVSLGAGVGIVSGLYPAARASRLDPVVALRQE
ncbi:MAG TPA: ABC transporter permease [Gemmatimonadaceae bacterium]|nr:ABC transporter permease [Gemmatimonadaceae bacterium]